MYRVCPDVTATISGSKSKTAQNRTVTMKTAQTKAEFKALANAARKQLGMTRYQSDDTRAKRKEAEIRKAIISRDGVDFYKIILEVLTPDSPSAFLRSQLEEAVKDSGHVLAAIRTQSRT